MGHPLKTCLACTVTRRILTAIVLLGCADARAQGTFAILDVHTANGTDSSYVGVPLEIVFHLDANNAGTLTYIIMPLQFDFSNGNIMGPIDTGTQLFPSPETAVFEITRGLRLIFTEATDPDTLIIAGMSFVPPDWVGAAELCRMIVIPPDTGTIMLTDILTPPATVLGVGNTSSMNWPVQWNAPTFVVDLCPSESMGDVNLSGAVTSSDIIYLVNYIFKSGPAPLPVAMAGDADCNRRIEAGDLIHMANYVFKSGPLPCPCTITGL